MKALELIHLLVLLVLVGDRERESEWKCILRFCCDVECDIELILEMYTYTDIHIIIYYYSNSNK